MIKQLFAKTNHLAMTNLNISVVRLTAVALSAGSIRLGFRSWGLRPRPGSPAEHLGWGGSLYADARFAGWWQL
jgi:hypothetical protein